jgi:hypothetical protein
MKKARIFLAMSAVLLAIGGAFASKSLVLNTYYEYQDLTPTDKCVAHQVDFACSAVVTPNICEISGIQLRPNTTISNQCGTVLFKQ